MTDRQRLLEGEVLTDGERGGLDLLEQRLRQLTNENRDLQSQLEAAERDAKQATAALRILRRQLQPLYTSLQAVFGELEIVAEGSHADSAVGAVAGGLLPRQQQIIDQWKSKLGVGPGKVIDALLLHGAMGTQQIAVACSYHRNTVPQYLADVRKTGLLHKTSDGRYELRLP